VPRREPITAFGGEIWCRFAAGITLRCPLREAPGEAPPTPFAPGDYGSAPVKAIQIEEFGGPEVLKHVDVPEPAPGEGEVLVEVARSGVNFADTHATRNDYLAEQQLPLIPGGEVSGRTSDGGRVAALLVSGGYAEKVAVPGDLLIPIPDAVSDDKAAALLLQGLTAMALVRRCARIEEGETLVVEAAAGGTGSLSVQLGKRAGARVIGLASTPEKRALVERLGADAVVDSRAEDLGEAIRAANDGKRVDAVLQMSGGDAFDAELGVLAPFGRMVVFGIASREQREVSTGALLRGSKSVIGFWLVHLLMRPQVAGPMMRELFAAVGGGELEVNVGQVYPLSEAARAHEDLIARRTSGKLLLDPSK
jgi:NADPH2:quinone reductase